ncbi:MAG: hypothetical protein LBQ27_00630, partial [Clostridiales bacterium]|nr:hypothetical protein [Clostridiales bacterium]
RIITEGLIKDVQKQVYDGTSKPTEVVFALDRDMSTEVIFDPGAYDISYYENGALLAQAPVKAGTYQVKLSVDNDNFLMTDVVANYFLDKSTDYDAYLQGLEFNGVQPYGGYVYLRFSYDGNDPVMTLIPANNEIHEFTWSVSVLGGARVFNIGVYTVSFLFKSPNFKYLKETVNGVPVYTDTYEYVVYYSIEAVDGEDVGEGGLAYLFDSLFSDSALSIEYTGEAFDKDDILKLATSYDFEANFIYYTIEVTGSAELKNIDSYNIKVTFVSYNHYSNDTRTEELTLNIVKKGIAIESLDTINLWFDGDPKLPVPTIGNTGVKDVNGQAVSAFVRINRIVGANGVDIPESKWNEVRAVGVYTFYYALVPNEYVTAPEREVTVKINKAPADMLRRLIFDNVKFNNTARFIYDGKTTFVPQITENNLDEKYGIVFVGVTPIGMKEVGDYKATFTFRADSFDLPSGVYEHVLNYDVEGPSNTWTIVAAVGGVAVLLVGAYFGLRYYKKTRPVADGLKPWQKRAPSYDKPQYKPASQGPKPVKEKKVKAPKEKD